MSDKDTLELLKSVQNALNVLVQKQQDEIDKKQGYKVVETGTDPEKLISVKEASQLTGISEQRIRGLANGNPKFPVVRVGERKILIIKSKLNEFFENNTGLKI